MVYYRYIANEQMANKGIFSIKTSYVTEKAGKALLNYKYAGSDNSLLYLNVWTHIASFVVNRLPPWIAYFFIYYYSPNVVHCTFISR